MCETLGPNGVHEFRIRSISPEPSVSGLCLGVIKYVVEIHCRRRRRRLVPKTARTQNPCRPTGFGSTPTPRRRRPPNKCLLLCVSYIETRTTRVEIIYGTVTGCAASAIRLTKQFGRPGVATTRYDSFPIPTKALVTDDTYYLLYFVFFSFSSFFAVLEHSLEL